MIRSVFFFFENMIDDVDDGWWMIRSGILAIIGHMWLDRNHKEHQNYGIVEDLNSIPIFVFLPLIIRMSEPPYVLGTIKNRKKSSTKTRHFPASLVWLLMGNKIGPENICAIFEMSFAANLTPYQDETSFKDLVMVQTKCCTWIHLNWSL